jgi:glycerophosphoryl diester phosphodiesterase
MASPRLQFLSFFFSLAVGCSCNSVSQPNFGRNDPIFGGVTPILFAHRGGAREVAESTKMGFNHAARVADVLELDVHVLNLDGHGHEREFVVWHGPKLTNVRITSLAEKKQNRPIERSKKENDIRKWNWADLKGKAWVSDPKDWINPDGTEKPIQDVNLSEVPECNDRLLMTLEEFLGEFSNFNVNIELKDSFTSEDIPKLVELLDRHRNHRTILVVTQSPTLIHTFREQAGDHYPTGFSLIGVLGAWLGDKLPFNPLPDMKSRRALQTTYHHFFTPSSLIRDVQNRNGAVHVFLTGFTSIAPAIDAGENEPDKEKLFEILNRGVDGVMTDRPKHVRVLIDTWRKENLKTPK